MTEGKALVVAETKDRPEPVAGQRDFPVEPGPAAARRVNERLRSARRSRRSPSGSGRVLSRQELADGCNQILAAMYAKGRQGHRWAGMTADYIGSLERYDICWPNQDYRAALRTFFNTTDAALGFYIDRPETLAADEIPPPAVAFGEESDYLMGQPIPVSTSEASAWRFFGAELRHHRLRAGLLLRELAPQVLASETLLGKVEAARRFPSLDLAQRCDAVLATGGILTRLYPLLVAERDAHHRAKAEQLTDAETQALRALLAALQHAAATYQAGSLRSLKAEGFLDGRKGVGLFVVDNTTDAKSLPVNKSV